MSIEKARELEQEMLEGEKDRAVKRCQDAMERYRDVSAASTHALERIRFSP